MAKGFAKKFYASNAWKNTRQAYVRYRQAEDGGLCEMCHEVPGMEVHHVKMLTPQNIDNPDITLNWDNLMLLCKDCHFKQHRLQILGGFQNYSRKRILNDRGFYFDEKGRLKQMAVYIVYGSPASGKTTYVHEHMDAGDMIVDLGEIQYALGWKRMAEHSNMLPLAIEIRDMIYQKIECRDKVIDCHNVWIIATLPRKKEREELAERMKAKLIFIDTDQKECERRARLDGNRTDKQLELGIIEKWFEDYEK